MQARARRDNTPWRNIPWVDVDRTAGTRYSHHGVLTGATYQYRVRALDSGGNEIGEWSDISLHTVPTSTPRPPSTMTPTPVPPEAPDNFMDSQQDVILSRIVGPTYGTGKKHG